MSDAAPALRVLALAAATAAGAIAAEALRPAWAGVALLAYASLVAAALLRRSRVAVPALLVCALSLGGCLASLRLASLDESVLAAGAARGADALLDGEVLSPPAPSPAGATFVLGVRRALVDSEPFAVRERVRVSVRDPAEARGLAPGILVRIDARLSPLERPGAAAPIRASAARLRRAGIAARAYARAGGIERTGTSGSPLAAVARAGERAVSRAAAHLPARERGLYLGIATGDTGSLDPAVAADFRATGLTHLLAVSGSNVAMVLGAVALLLRLLRAGPRTTIAAMAFALLSYMAITRFEPSVLRAGAMAGLALGGLAIGARREALTGLGVAALGLLCYDPFLARSAGFQLSALATLGILVLAPRIAAALPPGRIGAAAAVTLGAQAAVTPLLAVTFHQLSVVALPANLLALPAVAPATVLGLAAAAAGAVWEPLGRLVVAVQPALAAMAWVAETLAGVPHAAVDLPAGLAGLGVAAAATAAVPLLLRVRRAASLVLLAALLAATGTWVRAAAPPSPTGLTLTVFDVGQGDAMLVRAPGGATMLVDGGPDPGRTLAALRRARVTRIDLLVLTHPHYDHVAGLAPVAERYAIGRALDPGLDASLDAYRAYAAALARRGIARDVARAGMAYRLGDAVVEVLGPSEPLHAGTPSDLNNNSAVLAVTYGTDTLLLSGEVQQEAQQRLIDAGARGLVMTVPHHGSGNMLPAYFAATGARLGIVSVGPNDYGHPAAATIAALAAAGMRVERTDQAGDITVVLDGRGTATVRTSRAPAAA